MYLARKKIEHFMVDFLKNQYFLIFTHCFILKFSQCHLVNLVVEIHL